MSIATLKKKSYTLYGKSHSDMGFSLNGATRHPPPTLGRSVTRTPFKGPYPKGHGEGKRCRLSGWRARICGGKYPVHIHSSGSIVQTGIKRSTMNMRGWIETRFKGILHTSHAHVYKVDKTQGGYIHKQTCTTCPESASDYIQTSTRCTPYAKNETRPTYNQYYNTLTSECLPIVSPYKGINSC
jgi:hypothetical protein